MKKHWIYGSSGKTLRVATTDCWAQNRWMDLV